ncbi:MAG: fibronectin type III domain-containing protein [Acidobacteriia bacterium]|nr:fibronectin type III domain-containing protein [Terriglobia bacterium]
MNTSTRTAAEPGVCCGRRISARVWFCLTILLAFAALTASAQTPVAPTTNTIEFSGGTANTVNTGPVGGIVLQGAAISQFTGRPVRHLWVGDSFAGPCRMDPEIDAPGPWDINMLTCSYNINRAGAPIPFGGQFAYDAARHFLYFVDNNSASQGVIRIGFDPSADGGHGMLDLTSAFTLAGGSGVRRGGAFLGGSGCPFLGTGTTPNGLAMSPLGDIWVGFLDSGDILRFNSPATATEFGFGTCAQLEQLVATSPDGASSNGLAFLGHNLFSGDGTSPFVIPNADTTCLVPPFAACSTANGTVIPILPQVGPTVSLAGDQFYPAINGNNLYYGVGSQVAWVGNIAQGLAGSTFDLTYLVDPLPNPPLAAMNAMVVDGTDPANLIAYSAEDPVIAVNAAAIGNGRWWQTTQTSAGPAAPGTPLNVVAVAGESQITLSWSPAQVAQPVTSYTVHNSFISVGAPLADIVVNPAAGSIYPPTSLLIPGLTDGVSYAFQVSATNATGTSALSIQSNIATPPGIGVPSAPTGATAVAGDTQAFVSWTVSASNGGSPITSYTVSVLDAGVPTGVSVGVPPPAFGSNTDSVLIGGLINGHSYTFTVHATNIAGNSAESAPSNAVIPSAANTPTLTVTMGGPSTGTTPPSPVTYTITITNTSNFPASNISVADTLSTVAASISSISRLNGVVTVTTVDPTFFGFGQTVTIAGVTDPSFNGTFAVTSGLTATTFTYSQAGINAVSGSGGVTLLPIANILSATGPGVCTSGGAGVVTANCTVGDLAPGAVARVNVIVQMQGQTITNSATVTGTDAAGTALVPTTASKTTTTAATGGGASAAISVAGVAQNPRPNIGQAGNLTWTISNTTTTTAQNVAFSNVVPVGLIINSVTATVNNGGVAVCGGPALPANGGTVTCTTASLGGSTKNGAKPPQTMIVTVNVTAAAGTSGQTLLTTGTVSFGPGGTDTLPNSVTLTIRPR